MEYLGIGFTVNDAIAILVEVIAFSFTNHIVIRPSVAQFKGDYGFTRRRQNLLAGFMQVIPGNNIFWFYSGSIKNLRIVMLSSAYCAFLRQNRFQKTGRFAHPDARRST
jgi:hypothetical protein